MTAKLTIFALPLLLCAAAQAATVNTTFNVTATVTIAGATITGSGTANLTGIGSGNFTATLSAGASGFSGPYTISIGGSNITGTITVPTSIITTGTGTGSATVTGGTGTYAGATGSFVSLAGTGTPGAGGAFNIAFNGTGSITAAGLTGGGTGGTPSITGVVNNYSFVPPGFPNSNISPGTLFVLTGSNLADPSAQAVLQDSSKGLPLTLNGASITVTAGGNTFHPALYYAIAGQLAAVLPAAVPAGAATVTVSYNNATSTAFPFTVATATLGIGIYNGLAIATDLNYTLLTYTNSAKPGDTIVLWGSGLGAIPQDSDTTFTTSPHAAPALPQVFIGGIQATVVYAGDSGYPGLNQIDVTIPTNAPTGCTVSLVAVTGSGSSAISSNATSLAIAPNRGVCSDPLTGLDGTTIQGLGGNGGSVKSGSLFVVKSTSPNTTGSGTTVNDTAFASFNAGASFNTSTPSIGSCSIAQTVSTTTTTTGLDAGTISLSGPVSTATLQSNPVLAGTYFGLLNTGFIPTTGGSFTFTGSGGKNVGSFSVTVNLPNPLLTWTNASITSVNRSGGANITWTGGGSNSYVVISGSSTAGTASGNFTCITTSNSGQFTVPANILLSIPAGTGTLSVENANSYTTFKATGLDVGYAFGGSVQQINVTYN